MSVTMRVCMCVRVMVVVFQVSINSNEQRVITKSEREERRVWGNQATVLPPPASQRGKRGRGSQACTTP